VIPKLSEINATLHAAQQKTPDCRTAQGGSIVLVPTDREIKDWQPIASRELPGLQWAFAVE